LTIPAFVPDQAFGNLDRPKPQAVREVEPEIQSLPSLLGKDLESPRWILDQILPEGLTLLVSPPKTGKSFLVGNVALAAACGGVAWNHFPASQCGVLFLDLEQSEWFAQQRWTQMLEGDTPPTCLHTAFKWARMDAGGLKHLDTTLARRPEIRLVIVDVLSQFWPLSSTNRSVNAYHAEYEILCKLRDFAGARRVALVVVHHTNRGQSSDPLDRASGTNAMTGVPGCIWTLSRERESRDGKLYVTGRSVRERTIELEWRPSVGGWRAKQEEKMPT